MYANPFIKVISILIAIAVFIGLSLLVLPVIGAVVLGAVALIALLSFSGWIVRLFRGNKTVYTNKEGATDAEETIQFYECSQKRLTGTWKKQEVEDAEIVEKDK